MTSAVKKESAMAVQRRSGFTLLELLVVIAVITIMLLLMLPAVNAVRELGRRTQCINNQRNLVDALIHYESAHGTFPSAAALCDSRVYNSLGRETGVSCMGPNWAMQILGQIEEDQRYDDLVLCVRQHWHAADDCVNAKGHIGQVTPGYLICPSADRVHRPHRSARTQFDRISKGNYAACLGSEHYRTAVEDQQLVAHDDDDRFQIGALSLPLIPDYQRLTELTLRKKIKGDWRLGHGIGMPTSKIKDGTSRTIVLSEVMAWDGASDGSPASVDIRGVWTSVSMGASTYTHKFGPNSTLPDRINGCDTSIPRGSLLHCEQAVASGKESAETWASARSTHRGGVVAASADGSVRFYADDIHLPVWQGLSTRAGSEL
jgi:prepilin-type N-terminal cleavage/methylation domain-containing protein